MPKLPRNMIRRKGRPGYWFRGMVDGRLRQLSLGTDYRQALVRLRSLKSERLPVSDLRVGEAAKQWLSGYILTARNAKGAVLARRRVELYLEPYLGHLLVGRLGTEQLRSYRLWLEKQPISKQTVRHILSDARCLLGWCEDTGLVDRSPFPRKLLPRIQERPPDRLTADEVGRLQAMPAHWGFVARLALGTGLRWGELCRLQSTDVQDGWLIVHYTKSGKLRRVPLTPEIESELRGRVGRLVPFSTSSSGGFATIAKRITGLPKFHVHQLRHEFACRWIEAGGSLAALQMMLGHSTVVTTQRYARLSDRALKEEARRVMGGKVSPKSSPSDHADVARIG